MSGWPPARYLSHNLNDLPHDIAAVATDGGLERCGYGSASCTATAFFFRAVPKASGFRFKTSQNSPRRVTGFVMRQEDVAAFAFVAIWAIITLGAIVLLAGLR